jgi:hypothetical protein
MGRKRTRKSEQPTSECTHVLDTMAAEIAEGVELLRPHYPHDETVCSNSEHDETLHRRALSMLDERYRKGHWPSAEEIEARARQDAEAP